MHGYRGKCRRLVVTNIDAERRVRVSRRNHLFAAAETVAMATDSCIARTNTFAVNKIKNCCKLNCYRQK